MTNFFHHKIKQYFYYSPQYIHAGLGQVTWLLGFEDVTVVVHLEQRAVFLQTREHLHNNALLSDVIDLAMSCSTLTSTHHRIDPRVLHVHAAPCVRVDDQAEALVVPNVVAAQLSVQVVVLALQSQQ